MFVGSFRLLHKRVEKPFADCVSTIERAQALIQTTFVCQLLMQLLKHDQETVVFDRCLIVVDPLDRIGVEHVRFVPVKAHVSGQVGLARQKPHRNVPV